MSKGNRNVLAGAKIKLECVIGTYTQVSSLIGRKEIEEHIKDWDVQTCPGDEYYTDNPRFEFIGTGYLIVNNLIYIYEEPSNFYKLNEA